jgi:hypothetical protein
METTESGLLKRADNGISPVKPDKGLQDQSGHLVTPHPNCCIKIGAITAPNNLLVAWRNVHVKKQFITAQVAIALSSAPKKYT